MVSTILVATRTMSLFRMYNIGHLQISANGTTWSTMKLRAYQSMLTAVLV